MKARRKMPDGQRETSSLSSAARKATLILVFAEIDDRAIWRRSRSRRKRRPKDSSVTVRPGPNREGNSFGDERQVAVQAGGRPRETAPAELPECSAGEG